MDDGVEGGRAAAVVAAIETLPFGVSSTGPGAGVGVGVGLKRSSDATARPAEASV